MFSFDKGNMCRICHEGHEEEELVSPCDCAGTMGMFHISCLCNFPAFSALTRVFYFDLILYVPSTIFQLYRDGSSWVEPVLSYILCLCNFPAFSASTRVTCVASVMRGMRRRSSFHHVIAQEPWACFIYHV